MHQLRLACCLVAALFAFGAHSMASCDGAMAGGRGETASRSAVSANDISPYRDSLGIVARLSSETNEPFLFEGVRPADHGGFDGYLDSIDKFPSVRDCLLESEGIARAPDLRAFDWRRMTGPGDVAVCVFRIASSYDSVDALERWFVAQGFTIHSRTYDGGLGMPGEFNNLDVQASYTLEHGELPYNAGLLHAWFASAFCHSFSVSITYLADGTVKSVLAATMCK